MVPFLRGTELYGPTAALSERDHIRSDLAPAFEQSIIILEDCRELQPRLGKCQVVSSRSRSSGLLSKADTFTSGHSFEPFEGHKATRVRVFSTKAIVYVAAAYSLRRNFV
jgi:hypothetical protein